MSNEIVVIRGLRYVVTDCGMCGSVYVVPETVYNWKRDHGGFMSCFNGHSVGWKEGRIKRDKLRDERDRLKQDAARLNDELRAAKAEAASEKEKRLQATKRISAGVCPCCNRTFQNLKRHMATKHKNIVPLTNKQTG